MVEQQPRLRVGRQVSSVAADVHERLLSAPTPPVAPVFRGSLCRFELRDVRRTALIVLAGAAPYVLLRGFPRRAAISSLRGRANFRQIDRKALARRSRRFEAASDLLVAGALGAALATDYFAVRRLHAVATDAGVLGEAAAVQFVVESTAKHLTRRPLPRVFSIHSNRRPRARGYRSFYSGHTAVVALAAAWLQTTLGRRGVRRPRTATVWSVATVVGMATGIAKIVAGKHYPTDVLTGYIAGALIGAVVTRVRCGDGSAQR